MPLLVMMESKIFSHSAIVFVLVALEEPDGTSGAATVVVASGAIDATAFRGDVAVHVEFWESSCIGDMSSFPSCM